MLLVPLETMLVHPIPSTGTVMAKVGSEMRRVTKAGREKLCFMAWILFMLAIGEELRKFTAESIFPVFFNKIIGQT